MNRVSASRLWDIAKALDVPISFFFDGLGSNSDETGDTHNDLFVNKEARDLLRVYHTIPETQRRKFFDLARVLVETA